ncbi:hypothetical protein GCM10018980_51190 [Streptomyces capoamus]|uniref:Uncharacterized protein n=1 Tax=Streptomyces capoamus TaxID=68183 RepID=A0A919EZN4_9ACTN|nr:hypothetical protein [Streptomyces capoamus]GGW15860.1 hypothetical protein GCM10010501_29620 [Streptomyces libani subsp. rufus]GHG61775.1 hypothetical protein GCM10018980_51190 [Streptomyces capoamus]
MSPRDKTEASLYEAIDEFNRTACWPVLQYAQNRQYLAEHLANAMVPSWLRERKAETAGEEIAYVLLMFGLFPNDWLDAHRAEVLSEAAAVADAYAERATDRLIALALRTVASEQRGLAKAQNSKARPAAECFKVAEGGEAQ